MPYGIVHFFPGGTQEQYDAVMTALHPSAVQLPKGQIFHTSGASEGGWTVVAVHDNKESWEEFRDGVLLPKLRAGIDGGFTTPPQENGFETHNLLP
jgi:hypothetical protein